MDRLSVRDLHSRYDPQFAGKCAASSWWRCPCRVPGGFLFSHSTDEDIQQTQDEDIQQTQEVGTQLQTVRQPRKARPVCRRSARAQAG
jgi:hypothetical protein